MVELVTIAAGRDADLQPVTPFDAYLAWVAGQDATAARGAWRDAFAGVESGTRLAPEVRLASLDAHRVSADHELTEDETARLVSQARALGCTTNTCVQVAWAAVLAQLVGQADVVFGNTVSGRPSELPGVERMIGLFINTVPVVVRVRSDAALATLITRAHEQQAKLLPYHYLSLTDIQQAVGLGELFDVLMVFDNYSSMAPAPSDRPAESLRVRPTMLREVAHYPLVLSVRPGRRLGYRLQYRADLFEREVMERVAQRLERMLVALASDATQRLSAVALLSTAERDEVLRTWNATDAPVEETLVPALVAAQAARTPDAVAVREPHAHISYRALVAQADRLAQQLRRVGVAPEAVIAVAVEGPAARLLALLGVWQAGGAYLPVDTSAPAAWRNALKAETQPVAEVTLASGGGPLRWVVERTASGLRAPDRAGPSPSASFRFVRIMPATSAIRLGPPAAPKGWWCRIAVCSTRCATWWRAGSWPAATW